MITLNGSHIHRGGSRNGAAAAYSDSSCPNATAIIGARVDIHMAVVGCYQDAGGKNYGYVADGKLTRYK